MDVEPESTGSSTKAANKKGVKYKRTSEKKAKRKNLNEECEKENDSIKFAILQQSQVYCEVRFIVCAL